MDRFFRLMAYGYFPKELPPIFSTRSFASAIKAHPNTVSTLTSGRWTSSTRILLQQRPNYRRPLSILNPDAYVTACEIICKNYSNITAHIAKGSISLSKPRFNRNTKFGRAVIGLPSQDRVQGAKLELRSKYRYILKIDIKNFYRSIYTHVVPWAIDGKDHCKGLIRSKTKSSSFASKLDKAIQATQDGQTAGIPVGPDISLIIAESLLATVDHELALPPGSALRFFDDYEFGVNSHSEALSLQRKIEDLFAKYELEVNPSKTQIFECARETDYHWNLDLRRFTATTDFASRQDIYDLHNLCSELSSKNPENYVFRYALRRMRSKVIGEKCWDTWEHFLYSSAFAESGGLRELYEQLDLYQQLGRVIDKKLLKRFLVDKINSDLANGAISTDLTWSIFGFEKFNLQIESQLLEIILTKGDDLSKLLAIRLCKRKKKPLQQHLKKIIQEKPANVFHSERWLLFWELHINRWIKPSILKAEIASNPMFAFLDRNSVSFLTDDVVPLLEISLAFAAAIEKKKGAKDFQAFLKSMKKIQKDDEGGDDDEDDEDEYP